MELLSSNSLPPIAGKLVDVDWQFGVTAASSEKSLVGETFIVVKFVLDVPSRKNEVLNFQLSPAQFYNLLHDLERAGVSLEKTVERSGAGLEVRNRGCQSRYRESEAQTLPWRPLYRANPFQPPESVLVDPELKLVDGHFDQHDVDTVKRFRQRKEWDKYLNKIYSPQTAHLQKLIVQQLEQEKWNFIEKEIDANNELRLELAKQELNEQGKIIQERMEFRMNNALKKYEELKKTNTEKYQLKLEREMRRLNFNLNKTNRYPSKNSTLRKIYNPLPQNLYKPKAQHEILCPEAIPASLNDAYLMLERNLVRSKPFKKDFPTSHDCNIPKFYEVPAVGEGMEIIEEKRKAEAALLENSKKREEKAVRSSKSLIATLVAGRAIQTMRRKIKSVIRHLDGRTMSNVLDFMSKEFLRLQEQRKLLKLADVAERDRWTREAKESGRRQEEEQRLNQNEEMFKELMKTHQISSDALLESVLEDEMEKTNSGIATLWTRVVADHYRDIFGEPPKEDPYRTLEYVSRVADRCLYTQSENTNIQMQNQHNMHIFGQVSEEVVDSMTDLTEPSEKGVRPSRMKEIESSSGDFEIPEKSQEDETSQKLDAETIEDLTEEENEVEESVDEEPDIKNVANKLLAQVVEKAERFVENYKEDSRERGGQTASMRKEEADSLSSAYKLLGEELLKISGRKSKANIEEKIQPWVHTIANEATKRISNILFGSADEIELDDIMDEEEQMAYFDVDDFYDCPIEELEEKVPKKKKKEKVVVHRTPSLEYEGLLDEKIDEVLIPDEDKLKNITMKSKM